MRLLFGVLTLLLVGTLAGCGTGAQTFVGSSTSVVHGVVMGGQQPIAGASIQLYSVGTTGDGSAATPLFAQPVTTTAHGNFDFAPYSCTNATSVYLVATGGDAGTGTPNLNTAGMVAIGDCATLAQMKFTVVNELTTVAATSALAPYMTGPANVGASSAHATALRNAFTLAAEYINPATGQAPGLAVPLGYSDPVALMNTLGDILAACINTSGGVAGDGSGCGKLFSYTGNGGVMPTDTVTASLNIARNPTANLASLFSLATASGPFQTSLSAAPASWQLALVPNSGAVTRSLLIEPDNGFNQLYALVNNAQRTIDMTMYELVDTTFSNDLVAACNRGVKVRVILDQNGEKSNNTTAYNLLNATANCQAMWANPQFAVTHQKSFIVDETTMAIMTLNLTSRYYSGTRDYAIIENDPADIAAVQSTFNADYGSTTDKTYQPPAGDDLIWSPTTATASLLGVINNATTTLLVENEEMSASNVVTALKNACSRGVKVQITQTDNTTYHTNWTSLEAAGCGVHIYPNSTKYIYIHAKTMLADFGLPTANAYMGSINFSTNSLTLNRELGMYLSDPAIQQMLYTTMTNDYNGAAAF